MDLVKVRMVTTPMAPGAPRPTFLGTARAIVAAEGVATLWTRGVAASMMREASYSSIRMGLYDPVKHLVCPDGKMGLGTKILAGAITGAIGSSIANPTDLIKIRFQAAAPGNPPYKNSFSAFAEIAAKDGVASLWRGCTPTVARAMVLTASQMSSYDETKVVMIRYGLMEEGPRLHLLASVVAGLVTTTTVNPVDVVKTRWMASGGAALYKNPIDCLVQTVKLTGVTGLWRGWLPNYLRLGPHFIVSLPLFELLRAQFGLKSI
jgi:solute carrier family 25 protein 14/30